MAFNDLREWIDFVDSKGQLRRIKTEVTVEDGEVGRVAAEACNRSKPWVNTPALLFDKIKGYRNSTISNRIFNNNLNTWQRVNWALGLPEDTNPISIIDYTRKIVLKSKSEGVKPILLDTGPCKENIRKGKDVKLDKFLPVPVVVETDGKGCGRYLTTYGGWVTRDPDTGFLNVGMYRGEMLDEHSIGVLMLRDAHWSITVNKYMARGISEIPIAYFTGWIPEFILITSTAVAPYGLSEYDVLSTIRNRPVELVSCELFPDILVPATAEVVLEGYLHYNPKDYRPEGPFGEFTGHTAGAPTPKPWVDVQCITNRNDAIFQHMVRAGGPPYEEEPVIHCIGMSAYYWNLLQEAGVPDITGVFSPLGSCVQTFRVSLHQTMQYQASGIGAIMCAARPLWTCRNVFVFDDDIDITSDDECNWAFAMRFDAGEDFYMRKTSGNILDPRTPVENRIPMKHGCGVWTGATFDCLKPYHWEPKAEFGGEKYPPVIKTSPKLMEKINSKWNKYFPDGLVKK